MKNALSWFEIPVSDLDRATDHYNRVLDTNLRRETFAGMQLAVFPYETDPASGRVGGALALMPKRKPSPDGTVVYIDVDGKLDEVLGRVTDAGGEVVMPRTSIGPAGFIAMMRDVEGNVVGLHSTT